MNWFKNDESELGLKWQELKSPGAPVSALRAAVPGGWLVFAIWAGSMSGVTFLPDPNHTWDGTSPAVPTPGADS